MCLFVPEFSLKKILFQCSGKLFLASNILSDFLPQNHYYASDLNSWVTFSFWFPGKYPSSVSVFSYFSRICLFLDLIVSICVLDSIAKENLPQLNLGYFSVLRSSLAWVEGGNNVRETALALVLMVAYLYSQS